MEPYRLRPSPETLAWIARTVSPTAQVVAWRRLTGGSPQASLHRVTVRTGSVHRHLVIRRWMPGTDDWAKWTRAAVAKEAAALEALATGAVPAPQVVAVTNGEDAGGNPAVLMTRAPGRLQLAPSDPREWVREMALMLARIHASPITAPAWEGWTDLDSASPPPWSDRPHLWDMAIEAARRARCRYRRFMHGDYQHFNILWRRDRITAVVDWVHAALGPADIDVGHCRLNLAVLFSEELAEQFRHDYEREAGRTVDPKWDVTALLSFSEDWHVGIPRQVGGRTAVDHGGMNLRVEKLLQEAVARL
ncbi:MAG: phosphotransferase family protein [Acidimicrobiales bacterium]